MSKRNIIRVGDCVKITNPEIVIRCGYPLGKQTIKDTIITQEQKNEIWKLIDSFSKTAYPHSNKLSDVFTANYINTNEVSFGKILDELSYVILKSKGFGGNERRLHTKVVEFLRDKECNVWGRRVVKTGKYQAASGHS